MCLIRKSWKMCSVGVPPGTGLGNPDLEHNKGRLKVHDDTFCIAKKIYKILSSERSVSIFFADGNMV